MKKRFFEKGNISTMISFFLLVMGLITSRTTSFGPWVLAAGLFGFAGGITNWLAVKMLFDKVPILYGSGVIPNRFREIRETVTGLIMTHFFDADYLERFFADRPPSFFGDGELETKLVELLESEEADEIVGRKLEELLVSPGGMMLKMVGADAIKPLVKQFVTGVGVEIAPQLAREFAQPTLDVEALRGQVDQLLKTKLEELTPETVKRMMEEVIREHLGWLIVWGNVFGGTIGLVSRLLGY